VYIPGTWAEGREIIICEISYLQDVLDVSFKGPKSNVSLIDLVV
jgi:hypothetical protein